MRCVFLYGEPNSAKAESLRYIQDTYTAEVNRFIKEISSDPSMFMEVVKGTKTSPVSRAWEKSHRSGNLTSAYSQSAFNMAMDHLTNRMDNIRHEIYGLMEGPFVKSKVLFAMGILRYSKSEMLKTVFDLLCTTKSVPSKKFYAGLIGEIRTMDDFDFHVNELNTLYACVSDEFKVPVITRTPVRLVSTLFSLVPSDRIRSPYVISVTDPQSRGNRIDVPLRTSHKSLARLREYQAAGTVTFSIRKNNSICVSVAFSKSVDRPKVAGYIGVDVGINDMLHTSDGNVFGSFQEDEAFYKTVVEPAFADLSSVRNKKRAIRIFLKKHKKNLPDDVIKHLRDKMDLLERIIRKTNAPYRKKRRYYAQMDHHIKEAVDAYIDSLHGDTSVCTAIELLDIKKFDKRTSINQKLSMFARGKLSQKLMDELNWRGFSFLQVEPAYTSQTCPVCGSVDKANRNGKRFECTVCGYSDDADHVGAVNIRARAEDDEIASIAEMYKYNGAVKLSKIKQVLQLRHTDWWNQYMTGFAI